MKKKGTRWCTLFVLCRGVFRAPDWFGKYGGKAFHEKSRG